MDRNTWRKDGLLFPVPVAADTLIYGGHIVCVNADGYAVPGQGDATQTTLGISDEMADNTGGANGERSILVRRCASFCLVNNGLTEADVGKPCYVWDSMTASHVELNIPEDGSDPTAANQLLGKVLEVDADGVWVWIE